ncbi:hypothetical protein OOU_Y34scaffold01171g5 [Pyricularia oryzae Y34]|uniref:Uncharacterized protein n=1 Tax=Pyricularia oryzae (strain Y34) TaxID=1143189 RepID=A0AA97NLM4_PYRO3|nr:hypothetical protein OOU_Y34scaffold01171g5 [Pyricularia oryzae Y34]
MEKFVCSTDEADKCMKGRQETYANCKNT